MDRQTRADVDVTQLVARTAGLVVVLAAAMFLPAGTVAWPAGWTFLLLFVGFVISLSAWLLRFDPGLLAERMSGIGAADQQLWDKVLLAIAGVAFLAWLSLMGLDVVRFHWSHMPPVVQPLGAVVVISAFYIFFLTFRANTYLSPAVRVQTERSQTVVTTGPYRYVRHPLYAGFVLFTLGTAVLLGSWYGVPGALALIGIVARRAVLEERLLLDRLEGYRAYAEHVRYRFIPFLW